MSVRASVVVPTSGQRPAYLRDTVTSVRHQTAAGEDYEVIVVDNGGGDAAVAIVNELVKTDGPAIRYLREPEMGLLHARHAGARAARGEIVVYVDDDILAPRGWLEAMLTPFAAPDVACAGGKATPKWEAELPDWFAQFEPGYLSLLDLGDQTCDLTFPNCVWGCNMAVRKKVIFDSGGFNPDGIGDRKRIWLRGDGECGLQEKIAQRGLRVVYEPRAWIYHRIPPSRLTPEHFYWRFFLQGIQDSYVRVRQIGDRPALSVSLLQYGIYCLWRTARSYAASIIHDDCRVRLRADAWSWYGKAQHQVRTALSPMLRKHVLRHSYL